ALHRLLTPEGRLIATGIHGGVSRVIVAALQRRVLGARIAFFISKVRVEDLRQLAELVVQGQVKPAIDRVFPLSEGPTALAYVERHQVSGKVVLQVA
ncbi:MAG TPA: zinc-binding dehydrogenase, partial [Thermoplasmata archaeon]|nr:zinc-binding dehydrogenase [Thermoplasmata archaeon]